MKITRTEYGIILEAETAYELECLNHIANQDSVSISFTDAWNRSGGLKIEGKPHPWGK